MSFFRKKNSEFVPTNKIDASVNPKLSERLSGNLSDDIVTIRSLFQNSSDLVEREMEISGVPIRVLMCEGMVSLQYFIEYIIDPLRYEQDSFQSAKELDLWITKKTSFAADQKCFFTFNELFTFMMSGFAIILIEGIDHGIACGLQGYNFRSVSEPSSESNIRGSKEGFVEPIRVNQTLVRRRIKSPTLKFDMLKVGKRSKTDVSLVYLTDAVSDEIIRDVKSRLSSIQTDIILSSGYIQPYLEEKPRSIFSVTGITERPDTLCAKINEGRVGLLIDGCPYAIIVPYLFNENFQSMDDYCFRPYYTTFLRFLKYFSFFISFLLPAVYVAAGTHHSELMPDAMLLNVAASQEVTPFPLMFEALIIHLMYEIMKEAGLRLPRPVGHAVSIVGALVIGDAAVTAGIIGSPMVLIVALTAISSFVVPSLYEEVTILKFVFIFLGGCWGFYGITIGFCILTINICASETFGVPKSAPISPFSMSSMRDVVLRKSWRSLGKSNLRVQNLPGSNISSDGEEGR